jgi:hypothetical protein
MTETAEHFGAVGVKVCFQDVAHSLRSQTFASMRRFSFVVLTPDEQARRYLQQASRRETLTNGHKVTRIQKNTTRNCV